MQCEAILLGREQVDGAVDTSSLATLIRSLLPSTGRRPWSTSADDRYTLRCRDSLEFIKKPAPNKHQSKRQDDEGFESDGDDDSASTRSLGSSADDTISNSSSCCFVDDHVFKCHPSTPTTPAGRPTTTNRPPSSSTSSCVSSVATDSANSSGASDTEDTSAPPTPSPSAGSTTSVSALVKSLSLFQQRNLNIVMPKPAQTASATNKDEHEDGKETYSVNEVAFCHTDPSFPKIVVWVVKKRRSQRLSPSGTDTSSGLEAVVFECLNEENMKKLCENFQEINRRAKLEQYRHPHRRKDVSPAPNRTHTTNITPESIIKALKDATEKSSVTAQSGKPPLKPKPTHLPTTRTSSASSNSGPGSEVEVLSTVAGTRFNLVQRTDGDGVTHIEVSRGLPMENPVENVISIEEDQDNCGPSSIISISTPDVGNLLSANSGNNNSKSRFCKEIEGVIRCDVDVNSGPRKEVMQRQRQPAILVIHSGNGEDDSGELRKVWSPPPTTKPPEVSTDDTENNKNTSDPPQRPERKKFTRKIKPPAPQPPSTNLQAAKSQNQQEANKKIPSKSQVDVNTSVVPHKRIGNTSSNNQQMVVRGQFIRVSVDQQQAQPAMVVPVIQQGGWMYGNAATTGNLVAYSPAPANWNMPLATSLKSVTNKNQSKIKVLPKRKEAEDVFGSTPSIPQQYHQQQQQQQTQHYQKNRSRTRNNINANLRSKSPPARRPMAYRYIDTVPASNTANTLSNRFFGLSQKLREIGGSVVNSTTSNAPFSETHRRRNSIGELPARFEYFGESLGGGGGSEGKNGGNLKSVIKKNRRLGEYTEPKKVTFSAYATVQVVD